MDEKFVGTQPMKRDSNSLFKIECNSYDSDHKNPTELEQIKRLKTLSTKENKYFLIKAKQIIVLISFSKVAILLWEL